MLTIIDFDKIPYGTVFAQGTERNAPGEIYMTDYFHNRMLKWVAKKGWGNDFAVYVSWDDKSTYQECAECGDKVMDIDTVKRLIKCDDEVIKRYRK